jgi:proton glutamate symport protein
MQLLSVIILLALGLGVAFGAILHEAFPVWVAPCNAYLLAPLGQAFLRLLQFVVVPIVFSSLVMGLTRIQGAVQVGRYTVKLLLSYLLTSIIAVSIGLTVAIFMRLGVGVAGLSLEPIAEIAEAPNLINWLINLIPTNPLDALSKGTTSI